MTDRRTQNQKRVGWFKKGNTYHLLRKSYKHSEEAKKKIGLSNKGKLKGRPSWNKGIKWTEERKNNYVSPMLGKTHTPEARRKISEGNMGEKNNRWKGGITPIHIQIRMSPRYKEWRTAVFTRDNYTCVICGNNESGNLQADHIMPFSLFPDLRFDIDNGRTLCKPCHRKTDTWGEGARKKYATL